MIVIITYNNDLEHLNPTERMILAGDESKDIISIKEPHTGTEHRTLIVRIK